MRKRRATGSIVANPVLVGAVTTLVVLVAVFLAYNANNGLPFVPTRSLKVQIANGANLVPGNEVRSGGFRIGVVDDMTPVQLPGGKVGAELSLKLDEKAGDIPADTRVVIRPRSALGLKYVELEKGTSKKTIADGGTLPASQATVPVELDEVFNMFNKPTRDAAQGNLQGFGDAFAGRGQDLGRAVEGLPRFFGVLRPVASNLAAPETDLDGFFRELADTARVVRPVSKVNARLFTDMATTFEAFSRDERKLQDTIGKQPETLATGTRSLRVQRPFLERTAAFSRDFNRATVALRGALPNLNSALRVGTPVTRRSVELYGPLKDTMGALKDLAEAPTTAGALRGLAATVTTLQPQLRYLGPFVTVCNTWNMFWTFTAEHFTAPDSTGGSERALLNNSASQDDSVTSMGANEFANGQNVRPNNGGVPQYLHGNTWGNMAVDADGNANCQAGQPGYLARGNRFSPYGKRYERAVVDTPKDGIPTMGPNFSKFNKDGKGSGSTLTRVPEGQTFTPEPGGKGINP
ncbi:MAG: MCE family protein [Solirubrobacterales bacterium]|nr:MCE family protein [Solirubrobacterales bacterium]